MYQKFLLLCSLAAAFLSAAIPAMAQKGKKQKYHYLQHSKTTEEVMQVENKLERLYYCIMGEFSNKDQSDTATHPTLNIRQEIIGVPMWRERKGEYWLHVGWYKHGSPERAVIQAIYKISKQSRDTFQIHFYLLPDEAANNYYSLEWQKENPFSFLKPKDLVYKGCNNQVVAREDGSFELLFKPEICELMMSDQMSYVAMETVFKPHECLYYTHFYNKEQQELFFYPEPQGLQLKRVPKSLPTYQTIQKRPVRR